MSNLGKPHQKRAESFRRDEIDPKIESSLKYIEDQKRVGNITEWQAGKMYMDLHDEVLKSVVLDDETRARLQKISLANTNKTS